MQIISAPAISNPNINTHLFQFLYDLSLYLSISSIWTFKVISLGVLRPQLLSLSFFGDWECGIKEVALSYF